MSIAPLANPDTAPARFRRPMAGYLFGPAYLALEIVVVVAAAYVSWVAWTGLKLTGPSSLEIHMRLGIGAGLIVAMLTVLRGEHRLSNHLADDHRLLRSLRLWNIAAAVLLLVAFLSRRTDDLSRGAIVIFYIVALGSLWALRIAVGRALVAARNHRLLVARRILLVGTRDGIASFLRRHEPWKMGFEVVGSVSVGREGRTAAELARAVELARILQPDDVYLALPWSETATIDRCVDSFLTAPVAIHLAPEQVFDRFDQIAITRVGAMASLELTRPMPILSQLAKRTFDLLGAAVGLVLLAPVLVAAAAAIRLDGGGPVFFLQTRYGFNQRPFRIVKFRTMTTFADAGPVAQASRDDARITRVGRWLRRTNIDELPQLFNVLLGHMSLVGPRPHAVPHNRAFERRIDLYARRHNVRPGITGWAQVNGLRGETDTDDKMRRRVEADLFYIDNWSMLLDISIIVRTVFSAKAYRNAY